MAQRTRRPTVARRGPIAAVSGNPATTRQSRFAAAASPSARLGIVSGRRRQGNKTFLLHALAQATGAFYFVAVEATSADSLREFGAALAAHAGGQAPYSLTGRDHALQVLDENMPVPASSPGWPESGPAAHRLAVA